MFERCFLLIIILVKTNYIRRTLNVTRIFKFFIPTHNNSYSPKNTVLEPILISISLKSKSDDRSYCCRVYHSPRNVPLFLECSNNERGKQMRLTYETRLEYLCMNDSLRI